MEKNGSVRKKKGRKRKGRRELKERMGGVRGNTDKE